MDTIFQKSGIRSWRFPVAVTVGVDIFRNLIIRELWKELTAENAEIAETETAEPRIFTDGTDQKDKKESTAEDAESAEEETAEPRIFPDDTDQKDKKDLTAENAENAEKIERTAADVHGWHGSIKK